ncbi:hypothetical protein PR202_ga15781 [Eleusine coracana subsp. coracana]|uniref:Diacylglycerol glucosyltransferase N-terminal domain-containing protein n=1 Tax=Eleusine coracana subsp. coracana TaxID=191504 RepID=A0AAV5CKK3_ELECO|nr:hypothetical protein PR202_ga15781 [Eleusine coracana subsp. coracana]
MRLAKSEELPGESTVEAMGATNRSLGARLGEPGMGATFGKPPKPGGAPQQRRGGVERKAAKPAQDPQTVAGVSIARPGPPLRFGEGRRGEAARWERERGAAAVAASPCGPRAAARGDQAKSNGRRSLTGTHSCKFTRPAHSNGHRPAQTKQNETQPNPTPRTKPKGSAPLPAVWLTFLSPPLHPHHRARPPAGSPPGCPRRPAEPGLPAAFLCVPFPLLSSPLPSAAVSASPALPSSHHASFLPRSRGGPRAALSVAMSVPGPASTAAGRLHRMWAEFAQFVRLLHGNQIAPLGFASLGLGLGGGGGDGHAGGGGGGGGGGDVDVVTEEEAVMRTEAPKKVLILMSDTGGGHRASAEAIKAAFMQEFGDDYQVFVTDLWTDHTPWPFNQLPRSYSFLVKHGPLWKMTYYGTAPRVVHQPHFAATSTFIARFHKLVTRCYCPSTEVEKRALKAGLKPSQIKVYGLPVRPSFVKPVPPKDELRRELGMDEDLPAVLLMGGGEGMGPIEATAKALGDSLYDESSGEPIGQILIICGRNKKLVNRLQSINWKVPVQVKGFVTKMEECMGACNCIITKEAGNVPYVVENGCGKFSKSPKQIAKIVAGWFGPRSEELQIPVDCCDCKVSWNGKGVTPFMSDH